MSQSQTHVRDQSQWRLYTWSRPPLARLRSPAGVVPSAVPAAMAADGIPVYRDILAGRSPGWSRRPGARWRHLRQSSGVRSGPGTPPAQIARIGAWYLRLSGRLRVRVVVSRPGTGGLCPEVEPGDVARV